MKRTLLVCAVLATIGLLVWRENFPSYTYRFRLTVEINTPEGVKSGSSVIQVTTSRIPRWMAGIANGQRDHTDVSGEAVRVDLGNGKDVFSVEPQGFSFLTPLVLLDAKYESGNGPGADDAKVLSEMGTGRGELPKEWIPPMVTFKDQNDPESVTLVYATGPHGDLLHYDGSPWIEQKVREDHFFSIFGAGYSVNGAYVELTDSPVTTDIIQYLPWLPDFLWKQLDGGTAISVYAQNRLANKLNSRSFSTALWY